MYSNAPIKFYKNRSGKPDRLCRWIEAAGVLVWLVFLLNISLILCAMPGNENFLDRLFNVRVRNYWEFGYFRVGLFVSLIQFLTSVISLYLNTKRLKRKYDRMSLSLWVSAALSLAMCIILLVIVL